MHAKMRRGLAIAFISATSLGLLSIISAAFYLTTIMHVKIQTYPQFDREEILIAYIAVASAVGAVISLIVGLMIKGQTPNKKEPMSEIPKFAGTEYPFEVTRIAYEGVVWPVYAQDARPIKGEPLLAPGPKCPLCDKFLTDSDTHSIAPNVCNWKCVSCKYEVARKESIQNTSERIRQIAYDKLKEQRKERRRYVSELESFFYRQPQ